MKRSEVEDLGMPHFGLMDEDALGPVEGPLQRARLHIRGGKRRLRQGKISAGIVTLYDALLKAMEWHTADPEKRKKLGIKPGDDLNNDKVLYSILVDAGVLDGKFDYAAFDELVERAANEDFPSDFDYRKILSDVESVMTRLGVMPFDESELPPEDPATF